MKVEHTMTPEEIAQWEKDVAAMEYWPGTWWERRDAMYALARLVRPVPKSKQHGTWTCYCNSGCRCEVCREAARVYGRARYQAKRRVVPKADHGAIMRRWRQAEMGAGK